MRDPYEVLGMNPNSDPAALRARYDELKARYGEQRFEDGERGNEGARLLSELETNWAVIEQDIRNKQNRETYGGDYGLVENLIKSGSFDEAQAMLDSIANRDGKWHYYQSIVFYKREWLSESRAQLTLAIQMEPNNQKYRDSLKKLDMVMGNAGASAQDIGGAQQGPYQNMNQQQYQNQNQPGTNDAANTCANCVMCYCMSEMCCSMARCCG